MQVLPKDIQLIVYRYVHNFTYRCIIQQYTNEWVKEERTDDWGAHWCEQCMCFEHNYNGLANWRRLLEYTDRTLQYKCTDILQFYSRGHTLHFLPKNYIHTIIYK